MKTWQWWAIGVGSASAVSSVVLTTDLAPHVEYVPEKVVVDEDTMPAAPSAYGIPLSGFVLERGTVKSGSTFGDMLAAHGVDAGTVDSLVKLAAPVFDVHKMRAGHPCAFIFKDDGAHAPQWFVYEADPIEHIVFALAPLGVDVHERPVKTEERAVACTVTGALWNDLVACGADPALAMKLADVFAHRQDRARPGLTGTNTSSHPPLRLSQTGTPKRRKTQPPTPIRRLSDPYLTRNGLISRPINPYSAPRALISRPSGQ